MRRRMILALAVTAGAAAINFSGPTVGEPLGADRAAKAGPDASARSARPGLAESLKFSRPPLSAEAQGEIFAPPKPARARTKAAKAAPAAPAPPPAAPPFPYKYAGWVDAGSGPLVFLQKGDELVEIQPGKMLDGAWRVDALKDDRIDVSFVPGGQRLSMTLASLTRDPSQDKLTATAGVSPARTVHPDAAPSTSRAAPPAQLAARAEPGIVGGMGLAPPAARAQADSRRGFAAPLTAATSPQSQSGPSGPSSSAPVPTGRLGTDAPTSGSMPTGGAPAPTGKLGL